MGNLENLTVEQLKAKIQKREEKLRKIIGFVEDVTFKIGRVTERTVGNSNIHVKMELRNFYGFDFVTSSGESMMGGNTITIWYHGGSYCAKRTRVLSLWYQTIGDVPRVDFYDEDFGIQQALDYAMVHKDEIIEAMERSSKSVKQADANRTKEEQRRQKLLEKAERLKL